MRFAVLRDWRSISCPICEKRIRERDLNGLGCPYCGTYVECGCDSGLVEDGVTQRKLWFHEPGCPSGKERGE